jgi:hypothetical protein
MIYFEYKLNGQLMITTQIEMEIEAAPETVFDLLADQGKGHV